MGNVYGGSGVGVKRSVMKRLKGLRSPDEGELRDYGDEIGGVAARACYEETNVSMLVPLARC